MKRCSPATQRCKVTPPPGELGPQHLFTSRTPWPLEVGPCPGQAMLAGAHFSWGGRGFIPVFFPKKGLIFIIIHQSFFTFLFHFFTSFILPPKERITPLTIFKSSKPSRVGLRLFLEFTKPFCVMNTAPGPGSSAQAQVRGYHHRRHRDHRQPGGQPHCDTQGGVGRRPNSRIFSPHPRIFLF